jgi:hypothetical protein
VYFHSSIPAMENHPDLSENCYGIKIIDELDGNNSIAIENAICEVVKGNGYCCTSVIMLNGVRKIPSMLPAGNFRV